VTVHVVEVAVTMFVGVPGRTPDMPPNGRVVAPIATNGDTLVCRNALPVYDGDAATASTGQILAAIDKPPYVVTLKNRGNSFNAA
jgi:hypothetical protein